MIEKVHHVGIAVHSLDVRLVILSGDRGLARHASSLRRNLGRWTRGLSGGKAS